MRIYYEDAACRIFHADCRDYRFQDMADVLVTDPPYGMEYLSGWSGDQVKGDEDTRVRDGYLAVWAPKPALVFGRWNVPRPAGTRIRLVWDKGEWPGMGDLSFPWGPSDEEVYVLGEGWTANENRAGTVLRRNRIRFPTHRDHPTEKPVDLLENLIRVAPPGVVLDPFMGSGTTLVAAKNLGRRAIGVEVEERYCEAAARRLSQEVLAL